MQVSVSKVDNTFDAGCLVEETSTGAVGLVTTYTAKATMQVLFLYAGKRNCTEGDEYTVSCKDYTKFTGTLTLSNA